MQKDPQHPYKGVFYYKGAVSKRNYKMVELYRKGVSFADIGSMQDPPITRQRVHAIVRGLEKKGIDISLKV